MTPQLLLQHFDRIGEAPDAIPRMRRFILDLAVRGKLVEQDPREEPASELLKRIQAEKKRLTISGEIKKEKPLPAIEEDEIPFPIPAKWEWVRLKEITSYIQRGKSPKYATGDGLPVISQKCVQWGGLDLDSAKFITRESIEDYEAIRFLRSGDLLWNSTGTGTIGRIIKVKEPPLKLVCDSHVTVVRCLEVDSEYIRSWLRSDHVYGMIEDRAAGSTNQVELTSQLAINQVVPLPPLAEQHRIVSKVNELMALCDRLGAAQTERESRRDRLVASSLHHLNNGADADAFREHARFYFNHLPRLTSRPDHIKQLRQTILNLAVRGKLVPQDPTDEPASELLKRIQAEQVELVKARVLKPARRNSQVLEEVPPCELPPFWQWAPLRSIIVFGPQNGISPKPSTLPAAPRAITLTATTSGKFNPQHFKKIEATIPPDSEFWLHSGDLLFQRGNTREYVGMAAYYTGEPKLFLYPDLMMKVRLSRKVSLPYVHLWAIAPHARAYFSTHATGAQSTMPKINQETLLQLPVPIPPFAEQHRIVAKVDKLMALCDQLETQLTTTQFETQKLLEAILHEALTLRSEPKQAVVM